MKSKVMSFKASEDLENHLKIKAEEKKLKVGTYIKAILKKYSGFKEKSLV